MNIDWTSALLGCDRTIREAAELLTENSLRIVLVVDENNRLLGTVTDGDIRRALMTECGITSSVTVVMQKNPATIIEGSSQHNALQIMREKDLLHLPVLDMQGIVVGLETVRDLLFEKQRSNPVLLMAGGFGRRLYPLTHKMPKPLLPIGEKPILQAIIEQLAEGGFSQFFLAVHYRSEQVRAHFGDGSKWGVHIEYLEEDRPLGTAGALAMLDPSAINSPLLMMNGDLITRLDFGQLIKFHTEHDGRATICVREYDFQIPYGVVEGDGIEVSNIAEKPVQKYFINAGIYVLEPSVIAQCKDPLSRDMPDLLREIVGAGGKVNMFPIHEYWIDIGRIPDYERAQIDMKEIP
jgi:dTDP-glucose pyrophosphorylase/predicted transcriptional regulator